MTQTESQRRSAPPNAPLFMQPQQPVLDEPLDIARGRTFLDHPYPVKAQSKPVVPTIDENESESADLLIDGAVEADTDLAEVAPVALSEPARAEAGTAPEVQRRKTWTVWERFIMVLLVLAVSLLLITSYLYRTDQLVLSTDAFSTLKTWIALLP